MTERINFNFIRGERRLIVAMALLLLPWLTLQGWAQERRDVNDTTASLRYKVSKTTPLNENEIKQRPLDLKTPANIKDTAEYDERTNMYMVGEKIGDTYLNTPLLLTPDEYMKWSLKRSMQKYYADKNEELYQSNGKEKFDFTDMHFSLGPAEKIFGPGGVQIKTQGSAELKLGATITSVDNPTLPLRYRKTFGFDFDEKVNLSLNGKIGDKMDMNLNYNTEATFDVDSKDLKLTYQGKEDEIVKLLEAGNVSMPSNLSLVKGASSLFGLRTDLQFGKLKLQTVISRKNSTSSSVKSSGGNQLTSFELSAVDYEENRHFFLSHFFRDNYDRYMAQLPNIASGITVNRVEVWVTNKTGATNNTRSIIALTDLGESSHIGNSKWTGSGGAQPSNTSNNLYSTLTTSYADARDISRTTSTLDGIGDFVGGRDYEKLENARKLSSSEYTVNTALGYISLKSTLQTDQVLAVAYEYTYQGRTYQVGEFSTDVKDNTQALFVKSLKNTSNVPQMANWDLMMKNVYSLNATNVQSSNFRLDVKILSDTTGVYLTYLPEQGLKNTPLLRLMNLDRLDNNKKVNPNGYFDFIDGYTIDASTGRVFFPSVEPFGAFLKNKIGDDNIAEKYIFQELYDSTKTVAKQIAEKNKYLLTGQYKASQRSGEISLGATDVPQGSVVVTAGGVTLTEGVDYTVNYSEGTVSIINQSIIDAGTPVNVSLESNTDYGLQRKTLLGMNWEYDFTRDLRLAGTIMHLSEQPLTTKVAMGSEPLNNTVWGVSINWKKQSQWLTDMLDKLPFLSLSQPSNINFTSEFAQLLAGNNKGSQGNSSYIDDFEQTSSKIDISTPTDWQLSSTPSSFPESRLSNDIRYGYNRALLAWYKIDPLFTRRSSSLTPSHIKSDLEQLSNHYVREVYNRELFPNKEQRFGESSTISVLNLAYYPSERGPYNLNTDVDQDGLLASPRSHWGGMMRRLNTSDFEQANIEYVEFWLMDPFIYTRNESGDFSGDLCFDLGEISEDILKDGKKFYESGMPIDGSSSMYTETVWGRVPSQNSVTYAFNTSSNARSKQDIGLNGLSSADEATYPAYMTYLEEMRSKVRPAVYDSLAADPAGDDYHYFRGSDFDRNKTSILDRYKHINSPEGNSPDSSDSPESYSTAYKSTPDVEDINQDYTLNEYEKYFEYKIHLSPDGMQVGQNDIVDSRTAQVTLRNGSKPQVNWYLFRVPIKSYTSKVGNISDFNSIRFMRLYLTNFEKPIILRFATLELARGEWRTYEQSLNSLGQVDQGSGELDVAAVNYEENNEKLPVNYVIPPGITRVVDPNESQLLEQNEQALQLVAKNLGSGQARAVYKNTNLDLRKYKHIQMFVHANTTTEDKSLTDDATSVFIRLGSDYKSNYYEYEIPLKITPDGKYDRYSTADRLRVWPDENMLDIDLSKFTDIKRERNRQRSAGMASYSQAFSSYDTDRPQNKITVMGNPTLGEVRTMMIGVRNNSRQVSSVEVWVNELRLQHYTNKGGWAAKGNLNMQLSDLAQLNLGGHIETDGFGGVEDNVAQRRDDNLYEYDMSLNVDLGRFLPEKVKFKAPLYYSYSKEKVKPKYNPLDTDMEMDEALDALTTKAERDSLRRICETTEVNSNFSLSNVKFNIATKGHPMPYDPTNFSFSYSHSHKQNEGQTIVWEKDDSWKLGGYYSWSPSYKGFSPWGKMKSNSPWLKILKDEKFNYLPQNISVNSEITRSYYELQERDMQQLDNTTLPLTWASDFFWNRRLNLQWDFTSNIRASFNSATNAEIEQPNVPVNKSLYPDDYSAWKDSVWRSLKHMGTPLTYQQNFDFSWKIPINKIPAFAWVTPDISFRSSYGWNRGTYLEDGSTLGNTISNTRDVNGNLRLNMLTLYNSIPFLKKVNRKFATTTSSASTKKNDKNNKDNKENVFTSEVQLLSDTTVMVKHSKHSKNLRVRAFRTDGKPYPLRYKVVDANNILITSRDTSRIKLTVSPRATLESQTWYKILQGATRLAMSLRNVSVSYKNTYSMNLPGFLPNVGDVFGQRSSSGLQPGLGFAFGLTGGSYITKARDNGWLLMSDSVTTPASTSQNEALQINASLEPVPNLKIDLNASHTRNKSRSIQYMFSGMPTTETGSFNMTTISLSSAFESVGNADNNYESKTFNKFVNSLDKFQARVEKQYEGAVYPTASSLAGKTFDPANGTVSKYSADVMIPAFLSAYCGGKSLDIFPSLMKMLPNWKVTYSGLTRLRFMRPIFKSFNITHSYQSIYSVGSYNTFSSFMQLAGARGFVTDAQSGNPIPSSMYDISTVSINESFSPFLGFDMTFDNNITARLQYNRTRMLSLSMTSGQISEARSNDYVVGVGYKVDDLKLFKPSLKTRKRRSNRRRNTRKKADTEETDKKEDNNNNDRDRGAGYINNDLNVRLDLSIRNQSSIQRNIMTMLSQATSGNTAFKISFTADYTLSKLITLSAYYDRQTNKPLLSSTSYPTTTQDFGVTIKVSLTR